MNTVTDLLFGFCFFAFAVVLSYQVNDLAVRVGEWAKGHG